MAYTVRELSLRTFPDFETLAIKQGGCWCMFYQRSKPVGRGPRAINGSELTGETRERSCDKVALMRSSSTNAADLWVGANTAARKSFRESTRDALIAKWRRRSEIRNSGESRVSSSIPSTEGTVSPKSR